MHSLRFATMGRILRVFVQAAVGVFGTEWADVAIPRWLGVGEDNGPRCELKLPDDPVFAKMLCDKWGRDHGDPQDIPDNWSRLDLYNPPYCSHGSWDTFYTILHYPWEQLVPHTALPLLNKEDQGITALASCAPTLAILARVLGVTNQTPRNVRLIYWMENG